VQPGFTASIIPPAFVHPAARIFSAFLFFSRASPRSRSAHALQIDLAEGFAQIRQMSFFVLAMAPPRIYNQHTPMAFIPV
jgi:hypothetical protein